MATFTSFLDILHDPNNPIGTAGQALATGSGGTEGPGFASVTFASQSQTQVPRANSGRVSTRTMAGHRWNINISYNPLTRDQFEPVYSFLLEKNARLNPFYIQLPQNYTSRNSAFATYTASTTPLVDGACNAGVGFMVQDTHSTTETTQPQPGDIFTISDTNDSLHTKAYRVTRVMSNGTYNSALHSQPSSSERIVYFTPTLQRSVSDNAGVDYYKPLIRVILKSDVQSYSLGTNNLYQFNLNLEEAQA